MADYRELPERFRVAFSFAGAQRDLVRAVAERVEAALGRGTVFFDEWFEYHVAGDDADLRLQSIYSDQADLVVVCVSAAYNDKPWTRIEHRVIRALTIPTPVEERESMRVLPLRFGDGDVRGIHVNAIVPDVRARAPDDIARLIVARLEHLVGRTKSVGGNVRLEQLGSSPVRDSRSASDTQRPLSDLLSDLCSQDPSLAIPAGRALSARDDVIAAILDRPGASMEAIPLAAVRIALSGKEEAATALAARAREADSNWHRAVQAAHDLDASHHRYCAGELGRAFANSGREGKRVLYWALGNLGAVDWGWSLLEFLSESGNSQEYAGYALDGFSHMFRLARGDAIREASLLLRRAIALDQEQDSRGLNPFSMRHALGLCIGEHVDTLLKDWVTADSARIRKLAIDALGDSRVRRSVPVLESLLRDPDVKVRESASQALGAIATREATAALVRSAPESSGLSFSLHLLADDSDFRSRTREWLAEASFFRWAAVRAVGLRGAAEFSGDLRVLLDSADELERGCASLALARLGDPSDRERIESGMRESSSLPFEQVMAILAWITAWPRRYTEVEASLRANLAKHSSFFWQPAQFDIIAVLESLGHPQASGLARAWRPFYSAFRGELIG